MSRLSDEIDRIISKLEYLKSYGLPESAERRHEETRAENQGFRAIIDQLRMELKNAQVENARLAMTYGRQMNDDDSNKSGAV